MPHALVTDTVKVPLLFTLIDLVVAPLLHKLPVKALDVNIVE